MLQQEVVLQSEAAVLVVQLSEKVVETNGGQRVLHGHRVPEETTVSLWVAWTEDAQFGVNLEIGFQQMLCFNKTFIQILRSPWLSVSLAQTLLLWSDKNLAMEPLMNRCWNDDEGQVFLHFYNQDFMGCEDFFPHM